jgi:aryl-alcohol dehydrogenase-like predicted oxidoreductase
LYTSELGLGCASYWANRKFPEKTAISLVRAAVESGINYFDTGASYGCGRGETRLGRAIRGYPRKRLILSTKVGTRCTPGGGTCKDFTPTHMRDSLQSSLQRMQTDYVDILYLHGPATDNLTDELLAALERLKREGLARHIGINSFDPGVVTGACGHPLLEVFMIEYNILRRENQSLTKNLHRAGKAVVAGSALGRALYSRRRLNFTRPGNLWYLLRALVTSRQDLVSSRHYRFLEGQAGFSATQIALAWTLRNPAISSAVFGTTRLEHLHENLQASQLELPAELLERLERTGSE